MKRVIPVLFLLFITILPLKVNGLTVDKNNLTIKKSSNETVALYAEVDTDITEVNFTLVYTTYDVPAYFNVEAGLSDQPNGVSHKITFSEPVSGKIKLGTIRIDVVNNPQVTAGTINIHTASALTTDGTNIILGTQIINVTIDKNETIIEQQPTENDDKEPEIKKENSNLLEKIESEIVNIKLKKDIYEYTINIKEDIEELDLKPIAKDEKYKIEITSQKISELDDNQIKITVKDGENTEEYKIKVNILEEVENAEIDEEEFKSEYKYKGKWLVLIIILAIVLFVGLILNKKK